MWKNPVVVVSNGHSQKNYSIVSKPREKKCLAMAGKKQIALCLTLSIYFSLAFARLAVGSSRK